MHEVTVIQMHEVTVFNSLSKEMILLLIHMHSYTIFFMLTLKTLMRTALNGELR